MIRTIDATDYTRLLTIWESAVLVTHDFLSPEDFIYYRDKLPSYFPFVTLLGFEYQGDIVGFMGIAEDRLEMLFVDAKMRGKGVGKALIQHGIKTHGITKVEVNEQNIQAIGFYESFGFTIKNKLAQDAEGKPYPILQMEL